MRMMLNIGNLSSILTNAFLSQLTSANRLSLSSTSILKFQNNHCVVNHEHKNTTTNPTQAFKIIRTICLQLFTSPITIKITPRIASVIFNSPHNNMNRSLSFIYPLIHTSKHRFGSYYAAAKLFTELQNTAGNINKRNTITTFRTQLSPEDKEEFNKLIEFVNNKPKIGISSKIINKYYIKTFVPTSEVTAIQSQLAHGGLMRMICNKDQESELSLYDVNLFIKFLTVHTGTGSHTTKSKIIIDLAANISQLQGQYLLKIIDRNLPIGASIKTFTKAAIASSAN